MIREIIIGVSATKSKKEKKMAVRTNGDTRVQMESWILGSWFYILSFWVEQMKHGINVIFIEFVNL